MESMQQGMRQQPNTHLIIGIFRLYEMVKGRVKTRVHATFDPYNAPCLHITHPKIQHTADVRYAPGPELKCAMEIKHMYDKKSCRLFLTILPLSQWCLENTVQPRVDGCPDVGAAVGALQVDRLLAEDGRRHDDPHILRRGSGCGRLLLLLEWGIWRSSGQETGHNFSFWILSTGPINKTIDRVARKHFSDNPFQYMFTVPVPCL